MADQESVIENPTARPLKALERIPLPWYLIVLIVVTLLAFAYGVVNFPNSFKKSIELERAKIWVTSGKANEAIPILEKYSATQPDNKDWKLWLLEAYVEAEKFEKAITVLTWFLDKEVDKREMKRLDAAAHEVMIYEDSLEAGRKPKEVKK